MKPTMTPFEGAFLIVLVCALILLAPFCQIWAINTLFKTGTEYNLTNWFAMVVLNAFWFRYPSKK